VFARSVDRASGAMKALHDAIDLRDLFAFAGIALVAYGGNCLYPGAGWAVAGGALFWLGVRA